MRVLLAVPMFLCASVAVAAQKSTPAPFTSSADEVTRLVFEGTSYDIEWVRDQNVSERKLLIPADIAWSAIPVAFGQLGIEPNIIDSKQMVFGTMGASYHHTLAKKRLSHYFECGNMIGGPVADNYEMNLRVISQIVAKDGGMSVVRVQVDATARASDLTGGKVRCQSNGLLESEIAKLVTQEATKTAK